MCGIIGAVGEWSEERFAEALGGLGHRGPDNCGSYRRENLQLGHTRLSIIDPHPEANQPFVSKNCVLVYNGEIYNYKELIQKYALNVATKSDTEVLIVLYERFGDEFLELLEGMFAFALYDTKRGRLLLARDRFGKKPLYYSHPKGGLLFASELAPLLHLLPKKPLIDTAALHQYLSYLAPLGERTIYEGIYKLEPGCRMVYLLRGGALERERYYDLCAVINPQEAAVHGAQERIEELLIESIEKRLVADVEVAGLLSGGIDSSLICALYARISRRQIATFSIGYDAHKRYDESGYASLAAAHIGSAHHEIIIGKEQFIEAIPSMLAHLGEPVADSACVPMMLLCAEVGDAGYKVALGGEGSDEIFLGYDRYFSLLQSGFGSYGVFLRGFEPEALASLLGGDITLDGFDALMERSKRFSDPSKTLSLIDLAHWIPEVLMSKMDRMSMAHSLELRAPFLDHLLVEYLLSLPQALRQGSETKHLLKKIALRHIPKEIVNRRKKGFSSPFIEWYYEYYSDEVLALFERVNARLGLFNGDYLKFLYNEGRENRQKQRLWTLIIFCRWYEEQYERV